MNKEELLRRYAAGERDFAGVKITNVRLSGVRDFHLRRFKGAIFKETIMLDGSIRTDAPRK